MRKICVVTGSRAEYGLLRCLLNEINNHHDLELQCVVTGMHLSPEFGLTYKEIEADGIFISECVEMLLSSDTASGIAKSIGLGVIGFADVFSRLNPDLLVVLGDRYEIFAAVQAALVARIPIAHIHGGEVSEGAIDESLRHSITKMSHLHFASTEQYRRRIIQLGEEPSRVFNVGASCLDNINTLKLLNRSELEYDLKFKFGETNFLVTFHPVTLEVGTSGSQFQQILEALNCFKHAHVIFTKCNADTDGRVINEMIDNYVSNHRENTMCATSLGHLRYLSVMNLCDGVIGNSSSGLVEAPSLNTAVVNIGDRQRGRVRADNVVDCATDTDAIVMAISKILSDEFRNNLCKTVSPYGRGGSAKIITEIIANHNLSGIQKKCFYDL